MSVLLYRGMSLLDPSSEIVVLGTKNSSNRKTGPMLQTWILRADIDPVRAVTRGTDTAICGTCPHRGDGHKNRSCYVSVGQGPRQAWLGAKSSALNDPAAYAAGEYVRLGAYGDPAAVPFEFWQTLLSKARGWAGYTHQWHTCDTRFAQYCMASVESEQESRDAHLRGWRTYLAATHDAANHTLCPSHKGVQCIDCGYCSGQAGRGSGNIYIIAHGSRAVVNSFINKGLGQVAAPICASVP